MDRCRRGIGLLAPPPPRVLGDWEPLTHEERTRHEALFFSQGPIEGLLPGEKARELFLRSNLPLQVLSQIWQLVDVPHDNMLDTWEFSLALHLIQSHLLGRRVPAELPACLALLPDDDARQPEVRCPQMTRKEYTAYGRLFETMEVDRLGVLKVPDARDTLMTSGLPLDQLATIWDLAEVDRDGKLNTDEFCIACHLCRMCKKGKTLSGPVNVQALLPNKTPKTDLEAKKHKMAELETRKKGLMALKEKRRIEANREAKRVHLWRERLKLQRIRHQVLQDMSGLTEEQEGRHTTGLVSMETKLSHMEIVADRLKKEHEVVRQETARTIVEEQKMCEEVKALQEEADKLRKKRKRNSLIKDLDPFHQLYEERKEEKLTGVAVPKKSYDIHIPFKHDPFDAAASLQVAPLSGEDVFLTPNNNNTEAGPWGATETVDPSILELTQGFDDNFIELWGQTTSPRTLSYPGLVGSPSFLEDTDDFSFDADLDPVFKTISVTAEEDDLWNALPIQDLAEEDQRLRYLQNKLECVNDLIADLNLEGPQLEFRHATDYAASANKPSPRGEERQSKWDLLASRRRSTDAANTSHEQRTRSSSEPRRRSYHGNEHPHRSNSERAKRRSVDVLGIYPEEDDLNELELIEPIIDPEDTLFFESKQQKYRKNKDSVKAKSASNRNLHIKATATKLSVSPLTTKKDKKKKRGDSNSSSKSNSLESLSKESHSEDINKDTQTIHSDNIPDLVASVHTKEDNKVEESVKSEKSEVKVESEDKSENIVDVNEKTEVTEDPDLTKTSLPVVETQIDLKSESETKLPVVDTQSDLKTESETKLAVVDTQSDLKSESETKLPVVDTQSDLKTESETNLPVVDTQSDIKTESETELPVVDTESSLKTVSEAKLPVVDTESNLKTESETKLSAGDTQIDGNIDSNQSNSIVPKTDVILRAKKDHQNREDRISQAQTLYKGDFEEFDLTEIHLDSTTPVQPKQIVSLSARELRTQKAQSWCLSGPTPVPPPRRKSRSPKKSVSREDTPQKFAPNRSFLHSQSVDRGRQELSAVKVSGLQKQTSVPAFLATSSGSSSSVSPSPATSTTSLSPTRSPKKRRAPKPPGSAPISPLGSGAASPEQLLTKSASTTSSSAASVKAASVASPASSVPTSPEQTSIKAEHKTRSTTASTSSDGSGPASPERVIKTKFTESPVPPPRTKSKKGRSRPNLAQTRTHPHNQTISDFGSRPTSPPIVKCQSLPTQRLVSDSLQSDSVETQLSIDENTGSGSVFPESNTQSELQPVESSTQSGSSSLPEGSTQSIPNIVEECTEIVEVVEETSNTAKDTVDNKPLDNVNLDKVEQNLEIKAEEKSESLKSDVQDEEKDNSERPTRIHDYVNVEPVILTGEPKPIVLESPTKTHEYVNFPACEVPTLKRTPPTPGPVHEYVNVPVSPLPPGEPHPIVTQDSLDLECSPTLDKIQEPSSSSSCMSGEQDFNDIYVKVDFEQCLGEPKPIIYSGKSFDSEAGSEDIVTPYPGDRFTTEDIVASNIEDIVELPDSYELTVDYNKLSADDISLLVEHGFDYEIMDAAARKRELDRLRAQFFKPRPKVGATTIDLTPTDSVIDSPKESITTQDENNVMNSDMILPPSPTNNNNNSSSGIAPLSSTVIVIGGSEEPDNINTQDISNGHTTTISITNDDNDQVDKSNSSNALSNQSEVTLEGAKTEPHTDDEPEVVTNSKIVLDLDAQGIPEFEVATGELADEDELIIGEDCGTSGNDNEDFEGSQRPGLVVVSDPFEPWSFGGSQVELEPQDSWDEPLDRINTPTINDNNNSYTPFESDFDPVNKVDNSLEENVVLVDFAPISSDTQQEEEEDMATKSGKRSPASHAFGSPIYAGKPRGKAEKSDSNDGLGEEVIVSVNKANSKSAPVKEANIVISKSSKTEATVDGTSNGVVTDFDQLASSAPLVDLNVGEWEYSKSPPLPATPPPMSPPGQASLLDFDPFSPSVSEQTEVTPSGQQENKATTTIITSTSQVGRSPNTASELSSQVPYDLDIGVKKQQQQQAGKEKDGRTTGNVVTVISQDITRTQSTPRATQDTTPIWQDRKEKSPERKANSPERKAKSPERKAKSPERKAKSPERKAKSPERKAKSPEKKAKSPERKANSPERKAKSPERKAKSPERKAKSPERKAEFPDFVDEDFVASSSFTYQKSPPKKGIPKKEDESKSSSSSKPSKTAITTQTIHLSSQRPAEGASGGSSGDTMDPVTGLRRANPTPLEKAIHFVGSTEAEPTFRVRVNSAGSAGDEIEQGRREILDESRIKTKRMHSWVDDNNADENMAPQILDSRRKYEERRKSKEFTLDLEPVYKPSRKTNPADIDSRSLNDQKDTIRQQMEKSLSSENARLFPTPTSSSTTPVKSSPTTPQIEFTSSVDSESIGNLNWTKQHFEKQMSQDTENKKAFTVKSSTAKSSTAKAPTKKNTERDIDRDIQEALERDAKFRQEQKQRYQQLHQEQQQQQEKQDTVKVVPPEEKMRITKVQSSSVSSPPPPKSPVTLVHQQDWNSGERRTGGGGGQKKWEMTEVDRDSAGLKETIIEKELREQLDRERQLSKEGLLKQQATLRKEQEQSAFEQHEKEQERSAGESVIVREIREQKEREEAIRRQRESLSDAAPPSPAPQSPAFVESSPAPVQQRSAPEQQRSAPVQQRSAPEQKSLAPAQFSSAPAQRSPAPTKSNSPAFFAEAPPAAVKSSAPESTKPRPQPQASAASSNMSKPVTYEAAISTFAHPGENLIAKEIAEQNRREAEIRDHWKELGMEVPAATQDSSDTPFNRPDPHPAMNRGRVMRGGLGGGAGAGGGTYVKDVKPYKQSTSVTESQRASAPQQHQTSGRRGSVESEDSSKASSGEHSRPQPKVQPYVEEDEDEDMADNRRLFFQPQNETPVEREIRLARERDIQLQLERGLPVSQNTESQDRVDGGRVQQTEVRPRQSVRASVDDKQAMKRFASSRLQFEIEKEKKREIQMKGEGKISTISEDRGSGHVKYKDIMSPDSGPPPTPQPNPGKLKALFAITSEVRVVQNGGSGKHSEQAEQPQEEPIAAPSAPVVTRSEPPAPVRSQSMPKMRSAPAPAPEKGGVAESLIEMELREQKEREEDLRRERNRAILGRVVPNGDTPSSPPPSTPPPSLVAPPPKSQSMDAIAVQHRQRSDDADANAQKTHRRKSALAEQWEKKFSAQPT